MIIWEPIGNVLKFLELTLLNVWGILGIISTILTFLPASILSKVGGKPGTWLSDEKNKKNIVFFTSIFLFFFASFQAFSSEREQVKELQYEKNFKYNADNKTKTFNQINRFWTKCSELQNANVPQNRYNSWKQQEQKFSQNLTSWSKLNLTKTQISRLFNMDVFPGGALPFWAETEDEKEQLAWLSKICFNILNLEEDLATRAEQP